MDHWHLLLEEVGPPLVCSNSLFLLPKVGAKFREGLGGGCYCWAILKFCILIIVNLILPIH